MIQGVLSVIRLSFCNFVAPPNGLNLQGFEGSRLSVNDLGFRGLRVFRVDKRFLKS